MPTSYAAPRAGAGTTGGRAGRAETSFSPAGRSTRQDAGTGHGATPRGRIALFDNIKGVLIILVVIGHFAHPIHNENPALSAVFDTIYLFHMPLFVFLSGLFAKNAYREGRLNVNRIISFSVLGVAYQAALLAVNGTLVEEPLGLLQFSSAPWYLIGMAWWYALTPLLARMGAVAGIGACLAAALAGGCIDASGGFLALSRTVAFLPYFALGYYCPREAVERLARRRTLWVAVAASVAIAGARIIDPHAFDWFFPMVYGDNPYDQGLLLGIAAKLATGAIAAVFSLAVLRLIPRGRRALTVLGARTLQVYVLHRLVRAWLTFRTPFYDLPVLLDPLVGTAIILALSGGVTALCAIGLFSKPFNRMLSVHWLPRR